MSEDKPKSIYAGNGKEFGQYGGVNFSICLTDLPKEHIKKSEKNDKSYINLTISRNYEGKIDDYGNTHNITVNTWNKDKNNGPAAPTPDKEDLGF